MDLAELGRMADRLESIRSQRLEADKRAANLRSKENQLKQEIIEHMEANDLSAVGGESCVLRRQVKERAIASDWSKIYEYIRENDAFDLLHKRLTDSAVLVRKEDGLDVPGVSLMKYSTVTFGKAST